jgi:hypothetical protein
LVLLLIGCGSREVPAAALSSAEATPSVEPPSQIATPTVAEDKWAATPLAPDPAFALAARKKCLAGMGLPAELPLVVHDQRSREDAALYFEGRTEQAEAFVEQTSDGFVCREALAGSLPIIQGTGLSISGWTNLGDLASPDAWLISGVVDPRAIRMLIHRADGQNLRASVLRGRFLAYWHGTDRLVLMQAFDAGGKLLAQIDDPFELSSDGGLTP